MLLIFQKVEFQIYCFNHDSFLVGISCRVTNNIVDDNDSTCLERRDALITSCNVPPEWENPLLSVGDSKENLCDNNGVHLDYVSNNEPCHQHEHLDHGPSQIKMYQPRFKPTMLGNHGTDSKLDKQTDLLSAEMPSIENRDDIKGNWRCI